MGIDFGLSRIGIALSDETKFLARPYMTFHRKRDDGDIDFFIDLIQRENVDEIICGMPMNMQGEEQEIASLTREFMSEITARIDIPVTFVDERLSSAMAEDLLRETERDWRKRKEKLDSVAASIILQDYLDLRPKK